VWGVKKFQGLSPQERSSLHLQVKEIRTSETVGKSVIPFAAKKDGMVLVKRGGYEPSGADKAGVPL